MFASLSKYLTTNEDETNMESSSVEREPQKTNGKQIKTTNFLRKLRKLDSTENILNLVQLTEYKSTGKSKERKNRNKLFDINERTEIIPHNPIKENISKTSNDIWAKESNSSISEGIHNTESERLIHKTKKSDDIDEAILTRGIFSRSQQFPRIKEEESKYKQIFQRGNCDELNNDVEKSASGTSQISSVSRTEKSESLNISVSDERKISYESITTHKSDSSRYFETKDTIGDLSKENIKPNTVTENVFSQVRCKSNGIKVINNPTSSPSQEVTDTEVNLKETINASQLNDNDQKDKNIEIKSSIERLVEEIMKQIDSQESFIDPVETAILFQRKLLSSESIGSREVHFETSKIPIPIRNKPTKWSKSKDKIDVTEKNIFKREANLEIVEVISERNYNATIHEENGDKADIAEYKGTKFVGNNGEQRETLQTAETVKAEESSTNFQMKPRGNRRITQTGRIKSKLSIFNSGMVHVYSKKNLQRKEVVTKKQTQLSTSFYTKSKGSFIKRNREVEDNLSSRDIAQNSIGNITRSFVNPIIDASQTKKKHDQNNSIQTPGEPNDDNNNSTHELKEEENEREHSVLNVDSYVINETSKARYELKKYCTLVEKVIREVVAEQLLSVKSSSSLKLKVDPLKKHRRIFLELKGREMTESFIQALVYVGAEYKTLTQKHNESTKKNDACIKALKDRVKTLEKELKEVCNQVNTTREISEMSKTHINDVAEQKRKDEQLGEVQRLYHDIQMKNDYHSQLVQSFKKSVQTVENKIEDQRKLHEAAMENARSDAREAELKRIQLEETIEQLKQKIEEDKKDQGDLLRKIDSVQILAGKLKAKNKSLNKELMKHKYPAYLERSIQKMIILRKILFNIIQNNEDSKVPIPEDEMMDILRQIDQVETSFPALSSASNHEENMNTEQSYR